MQHDHSSARGKPDDFPIGFKEFVGLVAALMATNALSIDPMLPALPEMGRSLGISDPNDRQWIITAYFLGLGIGSLFYGPLSDRYGRKAVLRVNMALFLGATLFCTLAPTFPLMLAGRAIAGFFAAASRVLVVSIVRDRFHGDRMASVMSLIFIVFMIVPVLAPSFGQAVLAVAPWRWIFGALLIVGTMVYLWVLIRLPETLAPENRVAISVHALSATLRTIVGHRSSIGHMAASGVIMGALLGFLTSVQQIFYDVFDEEKIFPFAFAAIAGAMAIGSYFNSRLVERIGARRLSQGSLMIVIAIAAVHCAVSLLGLETVWSFMAFQALTMLAFSFTGSNFSAISMEPFERGAGLASSFQGFLTTILSALLGAFVGANFNGTTLPMALGFMGYGLLALLLVSWAERGKLFTRPHLEDKRPSAAEMLH